MDIFKDHGQEICVIAPEELDEAIDRLVEADIMRQSKMYKENPGHRTPPEEYAALHRKDYYEHKEYVRLHSKEGLRLSYYNIYTEKGEYSCTILMYIFSGEHGFQRVQMEYSYCRQCGVFYRIANPTYLGIYPHYDFDISELRYPFVRCPECGGEFSRDAIWCGERQDHLGNYFEKYGGMKDPPL